MEVKWNTFGSWALIWVAFLVLSGCQSGSGYDEIPADDSNDERGGEVAQGQALYQAQCTSCHGDQGQANLGTPLNQFSGSLEDLVNTTDQTMPPGTSDSCVGDCAEAVSEYIFENFLGQEIPEEPIPEEPIPEEPIPEEPTPVDPDVIASYYATNIEDQVVQESCTWCHSSTGAAKSSDLIFSEGNDNAESNQQALSYFFDNTGNAYDIILSKVRGGSNHGGGTRLSCDDSGFKKLENYLQLLLGVDAPADTICAGSFWDGIINTSAKDTLRRAALITAGRLPTEAEYSQAENNDAGLRAALKELMQGENFHDYLLRGANDRLLTMAVAPSGELNFIAKNDTYYPVLANGSYDSSLSSNPDDASEFKRLWDGFEFGAAMAPLELIANVVENERAYTEVLTADYTMVNPYSAEIYRSEVSFNDSNNAREFKQGLNKGQIYNDGDTVITRDGGPRVESHGGFIDYPHAGLLNELSVLKRYPSTDTNRNRARANWAYYEFLYVDIEKSAARTTEPEDLADTDNPTLNNPACTVCHIIMDPVAGAFQNYGDAQHYRNAKNGLSALPTSYTNDKTSGFQEGDTWFRDMLEPAFDGAITEQENSLQILGQRIVQDERFPIATVVFWWSSIMSLPIHEAPEEITDPTYMAELNAYEVQQEDIKELASNFAQGFHGGSAFNLKDLLVEMMMTSWFRAEGSSAALTEDRQTSLSNVGVDRLLTPEELASKTKALVGFAWGESTVSSAFDTRYDHLSDKFTTYYGGIDSYGITERSKEITALMSNVALANALEVSCPAVVADFKRAVNERLIFNDIDILTIPGAAGEMAIKTQLQKMHSLFLGESLSLDSEALQDSYDVLVGLWQTRSDAGTPNVEVGNDESCSAPSGMSFTNEDMVDPQYMLATWARMTLYFMTDYKFLHE